MINLLYIDLFCGAGGTSTGVNEARVDGEQCAKVIACVNHDSHAIASHAANHPDALHFVEDIRTLNLKPLLKHIKACRREYPQALIVLWASLECTNFSKAKGGQPRDADSRTLAEHLFRYIEAINPDFIQIENVVEFMAWGDLDQNGKPLSMDKGNSYLRWIENVKRYGYEYDYRILNAADYGGRTTRTRFFGMFAKHGFPLVFPTPTHSKSPEKGLKPRLAVRPCLNLEEVGKSIFDRPKPLAENTLKRIYAGLIKFVAGGKSAFLIKFNSMSQRGKYIPPSIDDPCPTVAAQNRLGIAQVAFLSKQYSGSPNDKNISIDEPAGTITCVDHHALVQVQFLDMYYGTGYSTSIDEPAGCVTTNPKHSLVTVRSHFLMNPQYQSAGSSIDDPCFTLIASMDKRPPCLVTVEGGGMAIEIYDTDSPMMVKIKEFMAMYGVGDIYVRMLKVVELKRIQGFPDEYVLFGTQQEQKKFIGNAVHTSIPKAWCPVLSRAIANFN